MLNNCKGLNVEPGIFVTVYVLLFTLVLHSIPEVVFVIPIALPHIPGPLTESAVALVLFVLIATVETGFAAFVFENKPAEPVPEAVALTPAPLPLFVTRRALAAPPELL